MNHLLSNGKGFLLESKALTNRLGPFLWGTEESMKHKTMIGIVTLCMLLASALPVLAAADVPAALSYLQTQQNADGGFGSGFSPDSTLASTADTLLAITAADGDLAAFDQGGNTPLTFLAANAASASTGGDLAKLILAAIAAGQNPREFGGVDSVAKLEAMIGTGGRIGGEADTFVAHTFAVLALTSAQRSVPEASVSYIKDAQQEGGAWAWDGSADTAADTNSTAFAVQALVAAGGATDSDAVTNALSYYAGIQNTDGGWPYQSPSDFGTDTDSNSTAVTIQALIAAALDPSGADWTTADGNTPTAALEVLQNESGAWAWQAAMPDDNLLSTVQALPAAAGKAFPFANLDVGEAAVAAPETVPETGGKALNLALPLLLGGLALAGGGYALRRQR
jgi:hypothetical protein